MERETPPKLPLLPNEEDTVKHEPISEDTPVADQGQTIFNTESTTVNLDPDYLSSELSKLDQNSPSFNEDRNRLIKLINSLKK